MGEDGAESFLKGPGGKYRQGEFKFGRDMHKSGKERQIL